MSSRTITEILCDVCERSADGDSPDFVYAMNCGKGHDVCCECVHKVKAKSYGAGRWVCPVCNGQVTEYFQQKKKEREERRNNKQP